MSQVDRHVAEQLKLMKEKIERLQKNRSLERHHRVRAEKRLRVAIAALTCVLSESDKKIADQLVEKALKDIDKMDEKPMKPEPILTPLPMAPDPENHA